MSSAENSRSTLIFLFFLSIARAKKVVCISNNVSNPSVLLLTVFVSITGGRAGILYTFENIPKEWVNQLARRDDIEDLSKRLFERLTKV
ncbi:MAG: hypothetical protein WBP45_12315 [Daejeonella sp.]